MTEDWEVMPVSIVQMTKKRGFRNQNPASLGQGTGKRQLFSYPGGGIAEMQSVSVHRVHGHLMLVAADNPAPSYPQWFTFEPLWWIQSPWKSVQSNMIWLYLLGFMFSLWGKGDSALFQSFMLDGGKHLLKMYLCFTFCFRFEETSSPIFLVCAGRLSFDKCSTEGFLNCPERIVYIKTYMVSPILKKNGSILKYEFLISFKFHFFKSTVIPLSLLIFN